MHGICAEYARGICGHPQSIIFVLIGRKNNPGQTQWPNHPLTGRARKIPQTGSQG